MIESIHFQNFKVLRDATLKLRPFNVVVGPNGSGKSTVFRALEMIRDREPYNFKNLLSSGAQSDEIEVSLNLRVDEGIASAVTTWQENGAIVRETYLNDFLNGAPSLDQEIGKLLNSIRTYAFDPSKVAQSVALQPNVQLSKNGENLVAALDGLRDSNEEAFNALKEEMRVLLPEFDNIVFETPQPNHRTFKLRQKFTKYAVSAKDLSEGTLIALALLFLAHNPNPPQLICLEEPDRGLHPRLLRSVRDALYRLSYPEQFGLDRKPIQIIVTTHSPYLLDLFKEHPEDIIIAEKHSDGSASFKCLSDDPQLREIIGDAPLGEVWYSGLLGGVPVAK